MRAAHCKCDEHQCEPQVALNSSYLLLASAYYLLPFFLFFKYLSSRPGISGRQQVTSMGDQPYRRLATLESHKSTLLSASRKLRLHTIPLNFYNPNTNTALPGSNNAKMQKCNTPKSYRGVLESTQPSSFRTSADDSRYKVLPYPGSIYTTVRSTVRQVIRAVHSLGLQSAS